MAASTLHIKNMVCPRCIKVVKEEFEKLGLHITHIELGNVELSDNLSDIDIANISSVMTSNGFELIDNKKSKLIENIKTIIIREVHYSNNAFKNQNPSEYIASNIGHDYSYLSNLFSSVEGITIEKYIIHQKIEKVKEMLSYDELTLNEISYRLGYSSVQYLSSQFRKVTGMSPTHFKQLRVNRRTPLDRV